MKQYYVVLTGVGEGGRKAPLIFSCLEENEDDARAVIIDALKHFGSEFDFGELRVAKKLTTGSVPVYMFDFGVTIHRTEVGARAAAEEVGRDAVGRRRPKGKGR